MPCCGQKRQQIQQPSPSRQVNQPSQQSNFVRPVSRPHVIVFEYIGKTVLTAIGPVSGRRYRFSYPGAIVDVDHRDAPSLATVPVLRRREARTG